jgi:hypothetical protein
VPTPPATLRFGIFEQIAVMVHGTRPPTDADWRTYLEHGVHTYRNVRGQLVLSYGGAPNAQQRALAAKLGKEMFAGGVPPSAVLSNSLLVRGVVTIYRWMLSQDYKAFAVDDFAGAGKHLGLTEEETGRVQAYVLGLLQDLRAHSAA